MIMVQNDPTVKTNNNFIRNDRYCKFAHNILICILRKQDIIFIIIMHLIKNNGMFWLKKYFLLVPSIILYVYVINKGLLQ